MEAVQRREVGLLADGRDDGRGGHVELGARARHGPGPARLVRLAEVHADAAHADGPAVLRAGSRPGAARNSIVDALLERALDLGLDRGHLGAGAPVEQRDVRAEPLADARGVDRGVAAADDDHLAADRHRLAAVDVVEERGAGEHVGRVLAGDAELQPLVGADPDEHGLVVLAQLLERDVLADGGVALQISTPRSRIRWISASSTSRGSR